MTVEVIGFYRRHKELRGELFTTLIDPTFYVLVKIKLLVFILVYL